MSLDVKCAVESCENTMNTLVQSGEVIHLYPFPEDRDLRQLWFIMCGKRGNANTKYNFVCSKHFTEDSFERTEQEEPPYRKKLLPTAIPTLNLTFDTAMENIEKNNGIPSTSNLETELTSTDTDNNLKAYATNARSCENLTQEFLELQEQLAELTCEYETSSKKFMKYEQALHHFTSTIHKNSFNTKENRDWSSDELVQTLVIRYLSKPCYDTLRDSLENILPNLNALQKWVSEINVQDGILNDYLSVMYIVSKDMTEQDKATVLHFARIEVKPRYEYDERNDNVLKPNSTVHLVVASGMFAKWKQPLYLSSNTAVTKETLADLLVKLEDMSYRVAACVSDYNEDVARLWTELGLTTRRSHFKHPTTDDTVYWVIEAAYLLKNFHRVLVTDGLRLNNGRNVTAEPLKELLMEKHTGQTRHSQIDLTHLTYTEEEPPKLKSAEEVFNRSVALDLNLNYTATDKSAAVNTAMFVEAVARWYSMVTTQEYGSNLQEQNVILNTAHNTAVKIVTEDDERLETLVHCFLLSILSLRALPFCLWGRYHTVYTIPMVKVCKNEAANLFSECEVMTPVQLRNLLKYLTLVENPQRKQFLTDKLLESMPPLNESVVKNFQPQSLGYIASNALNEADEVRYLVSAMAEKFLDAHPEMGTRKRDLTLKPPYRDVAVNINSFVEPSDAWKRKAKQLNDVFEKCYEELVTKQAKIVQSLVEMALDICPDVDVDVIKHFFQERLLLRIKYLNQDQELVVDAAEHADDSN